MLLKKIKYYFLLIAIVHIKTICLGQNGYGAPVYKQSFGTGNSNASTIGTPLPTGHTSFTFENTVCPKPGNYTIVRRVPVENCFNNEWIALSHDNSNTTADYGMMMVVNNTTGATNKVVYVDTINKAMCEGAAYSLSASFINLDLVDGWVQCPKGPDYPEFELRLEDGAGNVIAKDTTGPITSWPAPPPPIVNYRFTEFSVDFIMPAGINKMVLKISLLHYFFECAEDFAVDEIQLRPRGPETSISFDNELPTTLVKSVCFQHNTTVSITGTVENYYSNTLLQWQQSIDNGNTWTDIPGATSLTYSRIFSVPDTFLYRLTAGEAVNMSNVNCRVVSNIKKVEVDGLPTGYQITSNSPVCSGHDLKLNGTGAASYIWTGPNGFYDNISFPHIYHSSLKDSGWYYVTITSVGGCQKTDSTYVKMIGTDINISADTVICLGNSVPLQVNEGVAYLWSPAQSLSSATIKNPVALPRQTTTYTARLTSGNGCTDSATVTVTIKNKVELVASFESGDFLCKPLDSLRFTDKSSGPVTNWLWNFDNGITSSESKPPVQYYQPHPGNQTYTVRLTVSDTTGCKDDTTKTLTVVNMCNIEIPNAFTPNGDGLNDFLNPLNAYKATHVVFRVYNRLGQLVYETNNWAKGWDGRLNGSEQRTGVYIWFLNYTDVKGNKVSAKGTTLLIR